MKVTGIQNQQAKQQKPSFGAIKGNFNFIEMGKNTKRILHRASLGDYFAFGTDGTSVKSIIMTRKGSKIEKEMLKRLEAENPGQMFSISAKQAREEIRDFNELNPSQEQPKLYF